MQGRKQMDALSPPSFDQFLKEKSAADSSKNGDNYTEDQSTQNSEIKINPSRVSIGKNTERPRNTIEFNLHDDLSAEHKSSRQSTQNAPSQ